MSDKTSNEYCSQNSSDDRFDVAIMRGSKSDLPTVKPAADILRKLGVKVTMRVLSAHRTPEQAAAFVRQAIARGRISHTARSNKSCRSVASSLIVE